MRRMTRKKKKKKKTEGQTPIKQYSASPISCNSINIDKIVKA